MSISRGADPLLAFVSSDGVDLRLRTLPFDPADRHSHLLAVDVAGATIVAGGLADAPMTHSGDTSVANRTFGGLVVDLR